MIKPSILRELVLEAFKNAPETHYVGVVNDVTKLAAKNGVYPSEEECRENKIDYSCYRDGRLNPIDELRVNEIIWDLIVERIITVGSNYSNINWPCLRLTDFGRDVLGQKVLALYDSDQYLVGLESRVPQIDPIIQQYLAEGLRCFTRRLFFASAVMIGAAAEKAVLVLLESIGNAVTNTQERKKIEKLLENPRLPSIFDTIEKKLEALINGKTLPHSVHEGATTHPLSLFEMIRVQRNEAVHPHVGVVDRTKIFLAMQTMPAALEVLYRMINWFASNRI